MLKKLLLIFIILSASGISFSQSSRWSSISSSYSKGPVSPEYQYNYTIDIGESGSGKLYYTKSSVISEFDFNVSKKCLKKINKALTKSKVFILRPDEIASENATVGGPERSITITKWQSPDLDARPEVIIVPSQVKELYSSSINNLFKTIENSVPADVWKKAKGE